MRDNNRKDDDADDCAAVLNRNAQPQRSTATLNRNAQPQLSTTTLNCKRSTATITTPSTTVFAWTRCLNSLQRIMYVWVGTHTQQQTVQHNNASQQGKQ